MTLPSTARQLGDRVDPLDSYALPVGGYDGAKVPVRMLEGRIERLTWRIDGGTATSLQTLAPLRDQIVAAGYEIVFQCETGSCGGFDFRFGTEIVPAPDMHVDIRDFRFVAATRGAGTALGLLVSKGAAASFIQLIRVTPDPSTPTVTVQPEIRAPTQPLAQPQVHTRMGDALVGDGHAVLPGLEFMSGAAKLEEKPYVSLQQLALFLIENPTYRIALVGHTDNVGALIANVSLSKQRAGSVRKRLIDHHGIAPDRIAAEGMGYLAPRASNLTPEGRETNRRVEAVLLSN